MANSFKSIDIAVIGGGAAGFAAAISAAQKSNDLKVAILERGQRVARKILATGNGRCNLSNRNILISRYHGNNKEFAINVLQEFDFEKTAEFFEKIGILLTETEEGKVYPMSLQAASVVDMLRLKAKNLGIEEITEFEVLDIEKNGEIFILKDAFNKSVKAKAVIVCTGGRAAPEFGTDGKAYSLAEKFGHKLTHTFPALVQIKSNEKKVRALKGVKIMAKATLACNKKDLKSEYGEVMFTDYGLSGPPIFQLSRKVSEELDKGNKNIVVKIDLLPEYSYVQIEDILFQRRKNLKDCDAENFLNGMLNKQIARQILKESDENLKLNILSGKITDKTIKTLANKIKAWEFEITGTNPWKNAQVTAGGIDTKDISSKTMESKIIKNLYFAGEILDIDGDCGGFNLQWAWSSGFAAGENAVLNLGGKNVNF